MIKGRELVRNKRVIEGIEYLSADNEEEAGK
jgi:hypothetical protein